MFMPDYSSGPSLLTYRIYHSGYTSAILFFNVITFYEVKYLRSQLSWACSLFSTREVPSSHLLKVRAGLKDPVSFAMSHKARPDDAILSFWHDVPTSKLAEQLFRAILPAWYTAGPQEHRPYGILLHKPKNPAEHLVSCGISNQ